MHEPETERPEDESEKMGVSYEHLLPAKYKMAIDARAALIPENLPDIAREARNAGFTEEEIQEEIRKATRKNLEKN